MHVTVVGAGVAGLTAAIELAERGARSRCWSAAPSPGARLLLVGRRHAGALVRGRERRGAGRRPWQRGARTGGQRHHPGPCGAAPSCSRCAATSPTSTASPGAPRLRAAGRRGDRGARARSRRTLRQGAVLRDEAHLDPRAALAALARRPGAARRADPLRHRGRRTRPAGDRLPRALRPRRLPDLRGVKGEMLVLRCPDVSLRRPVRLLHPRIPLYVVPRGDGSSWSARR